MLQYLKARYELFRGEEGASAIEYGLLAALIAVAIVVAVQSVGTSLSDVFNDVASKLPASGS